MILVSRIYFGSRFPDLSISLRINDAIPTFACFSVNRRLLSAEKFRPHGQVGSKPYWQWTILFKVLRWSAWENYFYSHHFVSQSLDIVQRLTYLLPCVLVQAYFLFVTLWVIILHFIMYFISRLTSSTRLPKINCSLKKWHTNKGGVNLIHESRCY